MAVCETPLFTNDSDLNNHEFSADNAPTDTSSDDSAILLGTKRKNSSGGGIDSVGVPLKGKRRSSRRLSKQSSDGDVTGDDDEDQSSDDSDPHIDVNVEVIMTNAEDKLLTEEEQKADDRDRIENQMLAVALVKSVVETKNLNVDVGEASTSKQHNPTNKGDEQIDAVEKENVSTRSDSDDKATDTDSSTENGKPDERQTSKLNGVTSNSTSNDLDQKSQNTSDMGSPAMSTRRRTNGITNTSTQTQTQTQTEPLKSSVNVLSGSMASSSQNVPKVKIEHVPTSSVTITTAKTVTPIAKPNPNPTLQISAGITTTATNGINKVIPPVAKVSSNVATTVVPSVTVTQKPIIASTTSVGTKITAASSSGTSTTSTRSRTRASTRTKVVGLKAEYASIREPRYKAPPKPSLPVPNPLLSPASAAAVTTTVATVTNNVRVTRNRRQTNIANSEGTSSSSSSSVPTNANVIRPVNVTSGVAATKINQHPAATTTTAPSTLSAPVSIHQPQPTPSSILLPENNLLQTQVKKEETPTPAPVVNHTMDNSYHGSGGALPGRRRIFSIDLDPEGFDFDLSLGMSIGATDYGENASELPPIASTSYTASGDIRKNSEDRNSNGNSDLPLPRGRGMSFELFSFSTTNEPTDMKSEALNGGRPRGDSIIFDPISFSDGGIHDENALRKRLGSPPLNEKEEKELINPSSSSSIATSNNPGLLETPVLAHHMQLQAQPQHQKPKKQTKKSTAPLRTTSSNNIPNPVSCHPAATFPGRKSNGRQNKSPHHKVTNGHHYSKSSHSSSKKHYIASNGNGKDDTLHMPQGSAAAAAAAASLSSQIMHNTMNGTISHTSCPMELLNKGGRIGIYLPEARRARIAKFHSKRKNRIWRKRIKYDCRKKLADSRPRVKGRFVKSLEGDE